jgi:hypothetical protein
MKQQTKKNSNIIQIERMNNLSEILNSNIKNEDEYQELTAKQIEILQDKLTKAIDSKNEILFWSIFIILGLIDCIVMERISNSVFTIFICSMEIVGLICAAKKLGQEDALKLLDWLKNIVDSWTTRTHKENTNKE